MEYFIESSAKTGLNVEKIFVEAAKLLYKEYQALKNMEKSNKKENNKILEEINNNNNNNNKIKSCC